jgi:thiosulfate dehydrogenase [quinone] large subunit
VKKTKKSEKPDKFVHVSVFLLRVCLGVLFFYAGLSKILDSEWTAAGFLASSKTFSSFYAWFASAANIAWVDFLNQWGLFLIGLALIFGLLTRIASFAAILLMLLYYFPGLDFPYVDHGFLVDDHIIYIFALFLLISLRAGQYFGLDKCLIGKTKSSWI